MTSNLKFSVTLLALLIIVSLIALKDIFSLALFGDDWLAFYRYLQVLGPNSNYDYNHITYFFTLYGPQDILMGQLYKVFEYNSQLYHLVAYCFRLLAALSIYPLAIYLTKDKLASAFAVIFISITPIGLDTTNWVFNMPSYLSIACLALSLYYYLRSHDKLKLIIPAGILFFLAAVIAPIRMSAALPIVLTLEIFHYISNRPQSSLKSLIIRSTFTIIIMIVVIKIGSFGPSGIFSENITNGFTIFSENFAKGRTDLIFNQIVTLGSMIIPDFIITNTPSITKKFEFISWQFAIFIMYFGVIYLINKSLKKPLGNQFIPLILSSVLWNLMVYLVYINNVNTFNQAKHLILLSIGGYLLISTFYLFIKNLSDKKISQALLLSVMLMLLTFFVAWGRSPTIIYETTHRYLIVSTLGIALLFAVLISLATKKGKILVISLITIITLIHIYASQFYLYNLQIYHGIQLSNKIWQQFPYYSQIKDDPGPVVFYFTKDDQSSAILHNVITFGLPPHMALIYGRTNWNTVPMDDWKEVESAVKDGLIFKKYGFITQPINPNQVYSFHLQNKDQLIDKTNEIRHLLNSNE